jgi:hypothetical protein
VSSLISVAASVPSVPVFPQVVIVAPAFISKCDALIIDPTGSTGNGGRTWGSVQWSVAGPSGSYYDSIAEYLNKYGATTSDLIEIPLNYTVNYPGSYTFILKLTNFLGSFAIGAVASTITSSVGTPNLQISGPGVVTTTRSSEVNLFASATLPGCAVGSLTLSYSWAIYKGSVLTSIKSSSLDPKSLKVKAYQLDASTEYTALVTASNKDASSFASVVIRVGQQGVKALLAGGLNRSMSIDDGSTTLDASGSYDLDYPNLLDVGLSFSWECTVQTSSSFGEDCGALVQSSASLGLAVFNVSNLIIGKSSNFYNMWLTRAVLHLAVARLSR